ncbi:hypothetical protein EJB05_14125 [Eragrostis curvula]|uniref:Uncharacterized protein n=1 Tax=Eragrostis curvula TaxID=38414 RepID=A0A5J9VYH8_9POAL|nr:hypothetical protein EJB05_14125 [Eragrostis curvula]
MAAREQLVPVVMGGASGVTVTAEGIGKMVMLQQVAGTRIAPEICGIKLIWHGNQGVTFGY